MHRPDISRLNHNRNIYLKIGLAIAIGFSILAFQWEVDIAEPFTHEVQFESDEDWIRPIPQTRHIKKTLPPPPKIETISTEIEKIEVQFTPEPIVQSTEIITAATKPDLEITNTPARVPVIPEPTPPKRKKELPPIEMPLDFAEQMPRFPGCEDQGLTKEELKKCSEKAFFSFLAKEVKYPTMASENGVEGKVYVQFIVDQSGQISDVEVIRNIGAGCGKESVRVVKKMPKWIPGKQRGRPVKVRMRLPIHFKLLK